jgi:hypothetical protein
MRLSLALTAWLPSLAASLVMPNSLPIVTVKNGSYIGNYNAHFVEDEFLGIPYAQPPVGDLRFRAAVSLNATWNETKTAQSYSPIVSYPRQVIVEKLANLDGLVCWIWCELIRKQRQKKYQTLTGI